MRGAKRAGRSQSKPAPRGSSTPAQGHAATQRRTRQLVEVSTRGASFVFRHRAGNAVILVLIVVAAVQLFILQVTEAPALRAQAAGQLKVTDVARAVRGSIVDRNNDQLAFTIESRALTFQPKRIRQQLEEAKKQEPGRPRPATAAGRHRQRRSRAG